MLVELLESQKSSSLVFLVLEGLTKLLEMAEKYLCACFARNTRGKGILQNSFSVQAFL